jgi:gas vesicle protein
MEDKMKKETGNVALAFVLGLVAGGVTALLFAPASGKETRAKIKEGYNKAKDRAMEGLSEAKESAKLHKDALKAAYEEGKDAYKRALEEKS